MHTDTEDGFQDNEQEVREQLTLNEVPEGIQTESPLAAPVEEEKPHDAKKKFIQELGSELLHLAKIAIVCLIKCSNKYSRYLLHLLHFPPWVLLIYYI
jgi:hypothetical protein